MKHVFLLVVMLILFPGQLLAQDFKLSAEIRPRFESKHGYKTLSSETVSNANSISQRTRLNFSLQKEKIQLGISLQNVRLWGEQQTLASNDLNGTALHEAWAATKLCKKISLKVGRQEIVYDDHRIFGSVGWAQQARSHDAFIFKLKPSTKHKLDIGFAYNAKSGNADVLYDIQHKNFQYLWYHGNFDKLGVSFLALNTGVEYDSDTNLMDEVVTQKVTYMQTVGPRITYKKGGLKANAATYFQSGEIGGTKVNTLYYTFNVNYKLIDGLNIGAGYESLSGKNQDDTSTEMKSFAPLFGTNHKFNGWMDYFYVGNHGNSVGLNDINAVINYKNKAFSAKLIPHMFSTAADVYNGSTKMDANLGTEIDFVMGYKFSDAIQFNAGYSQMFATETMEILKGGDKDATNNWGWVMFTFKPVLFKN